MTRSRLSWQCPALAPQQAETGPSVKEIFTLLLPPGRSSLKKRQTELSIHNLRVWAMDVASMPKLTCITTTYNDGETLLTATRSVLAQSFRDFQYLIVDDGSTDDTLAVLRGIDDPRVQVIRQANDGLSSARNRALQHVTGDYVCFLDSDDVRPNWSFAAVLAAINQGAPDVILCRGILSELRGDLTGFYDDAVFHQIAGLCPEGPVRRGDAEFARARLLAQRVEPQSANKAVRTAFLREIGLQFPDGHFFEDIFFHTGLLSQAQSLGFVQSPCFTYFRRYQRPQITASPGERRFDALAVAKMTLEAFARTLEFHDAALRSVVLASCLRIVAWCEASISHPSRHTFRQTLRALLAGLDPLYLNIPADLPPEAGALQPLQDYLEGMRDAA
jgi:Glycosyl transferase family 2